MKITQLLWLEAVLSKLDQKHKVSAREVEEALDTCKRYRKMIKGRFQGEDVFRALGQTKAGRHLTIFFILKPAQSALILSARDMDHKERKSYVKQ